MAVNDEHRQEALPPPVVQHAGGVLDGQVMRAGVNLGHSLALPSAKATMAAAVQSRLNVACMYSRRTFSLLGSATSKRAAATMLAAFFSACCGVGMVTGESS